MTLPYGAAWGLLALLAAALVGCQGRAPEANPPALPVTSTPARQASAAASVAAGSPIALVQSTPAAPAVTPFPDSTGLPERESATATATAPAPTASATKRPAPTATATPTPTPTTAPAARRLTSGGCCWDPFFLDGQVAYLDRPGPDAPAGYYAVPPGGGDPRLVESRAGFFLGGGAYFSYQDKGLTVIERRQDGRRWQIDTTGQPVVLSPDGSEVAWSLREWEGAFDRRRSQLWRAPLEGGAPVQVLSLYGGGLSAWLPGDRWLLTGRRAVAETDRALLLYDLKTGQSRELLRAQGFRSISVAPDGKWAAVLIALDPKRERNGMWLVPIDGGEPRKLEWFGAFAWRDPGHIYYLPYQAEAASNEVWLYDVAAGTSRRLTDSSITPFKIAQGDFVFAPDGKSLVYVSAQDLNLWILDLGL